MLGRKKSIIYLLANFSRQGAQGIWMPIVAVFLAPVDLVRFSLLQAVIVISSILGTLCLGRSSDRLIFDYENGEGRSDFIVTAIVTMIGLVGCVTVVIAFAGTGLVTSNILIQNNSGLIGLIGIVVALTGVVELLGALLRALGKSSQFLLLSILCGFGQIAFGCVGLILFSDKIFGICLGIGLSLLLAIIVAGRETIKSAFSKGEVKVECITSSLNYCLPVVVHNVGFWLINMSGRWVGSLTLEPEAQPLLMLILLIISGLTIVPNAIFNSVLPALGEAGGRNDMENVRKIANKVGDYSAIAAVIVTCGAGLFLHLITNLKSGFGEVKVTYIAAILAYAFAHSMYVRYQQILWARRQGLRLAVGTICSGIISLLIMLYMASYGADGILFAVAVGMLVQSVISWRQATR